MKRKLLTPDKQYGELLTGSTILAFSEIEFAVGLLPKKDQHEGKASDLDGVTNCGERVFADWRNMKSFGFEIAFVTDNVKSR